MDIDREYIQELAKLKSRRKAAKLLSEAGFELSGCFVTYGSIQVDAKDLPRMRRILGCPLKYRGAWAENKQTIRCRVSPERFPGVMIYYDRALPASAKCKIVTTTEYREESRLLCSA